MQLIKFLSIVLLLSDYSANIMAQDTTNNLMNKLENETTINQTTYTTATFKYTRVIDGHSVENLPKNVLDLRISHRFNPINTGIYNFFGLDNAVMRLGFDYGITNNFMVGIGHNVFQKTYDGFFKIKILSQSTGKKNMPLTLSFVPVIAINTLIQPDSPKIHFSDRVSSVFQILIARKFSENFSLQLMPTYIHADNISFDHQKQNIVAIGIASTHRLSKRINLNAEYYFQLPEMQAQNSHNVLSFGVDIGTGGHVFQLLFSNSTGMTEKTFISETTGHWNDMDALFGFNISRVFQLKKAARSKPEWKL